MALVSSDMAAPEDVVQFGQIGGAHVDIRRPSGAARTSRAWTNLEYIGCLTPPQAATDVTLTMLDSDSDGEPNSEPEAILPIMPTVGSESGTSAGQPLERELERLQAELQKKDAALLTAAKQLVDRESMLRAELATAAIENKRLTAIVADADAERARLTDALARADTEASMAWTTASRAAADTKTARAAALEAAAVARKVSFFAAEHRAVILETGVRRLRTKLRHRVAACDARRGGGGDGDGDDDGAAGEPPHVCLEARYVSSCGLFCFVHATKNLFCFVSLFLCFVYLFLVVASDRARVLCCELTSRSFCFAQFISYRPMSTTPLSVLSRGSVSPRATRVTWRHPTRRAAETNNDVSLAPPKARRA